jgi:hypothetical protein
VHVGRAIPLQMQERGVQACEAVGHGADGRTTTVTAVT